VQVDLKFTGAQVRVVVDNDKGTHSQKYSLCFFKKITRSPSSWVVANYQGHILEKKKVLSIVTSFSKYTRELTVEIFFLATTILTTPPIPGYVCMCVGGGWGGGGGGGGARGGGGGGGGGGGCGGGGGASLSAQRQKFWKVSALAYVCVLIGL
jgi:hypothetical protein